MFAWHSVARMFALWLGFLSVSILSKSVSLFEQSKISFRSDVSFAGRPDKSTAHDVVFVVAPKNMEDLERVLYDVSSTQSPNYGKHWSRKQVEDLTHNKEGHALIMKFLRDNHVTVTKVSQYGNYIHATAELSKWETLFATEFHQYQLSHLDHPLHRCLSVSLPTELLPHVQGIFNTVQFPHPWKRNRKEVDASTLNLWETEQAQSASYAGYVYPGLINQYYNVTNNTASFRVTQAVYESLGQQMSPSDLTYFQNYFHLPLQPITRDIGGNANDAKCDGSTCGEANLDIQYLMGIAQHANTTFWYTDDWMFGWIVSVGDSDYPSDVYSISYGGQETGLESSYTSSFNNEAIKLGTMGVSLLVASGDTGAPGSYGNQGTKYCGYNPQFPASSPYVTTVGATMGPQSSQPEVGCQAAQGTSVLITSGGGFSTHFLQPSWQKQAVATYFATVDGTSQEPYQGTSAIEYNDLPYEYIDYIKIPTYFNASGRGYPDVALLGHSYMVVIGESIQVEDGTSASTPVMAAFVTLANQQRVTAGTAKMGFLNPFLYENSAKFVHDVTSGNNKCTEAYGCTNSGCKVHCCSEGFYATTGWDPMTGLGSVSYREFVETALSVVGVGAPTLRPTEPPHSSAPTSTHHPTLTPSHSPTHKPTTHQPSLAPVLTIPPVTIPPVTIPPVTIPPVTIPPFTLPPVSQSPTVAPVTIPPVTIPPITLPPAIPPFAVPTLAPVSKVPTRVPTLRPSTLSPTTQSPTSEYLGITFTVFQIISGISASMYESALSSNNFVVSETVAYFLAGASASTITVEKVSDSSLSSINSLAMGSIVGDMGLRSRAWFGLASDKTVSSSSAVNITYSVNIPNIYSANYASTSAAYNQSKSALLLAINDGQFTLKLNSNAVQQGSSNLNTAEAKTSPSFSNYTVTAASVETNGGSSGGNPATVSAGGIAGIVVAIVVFFGALAAFAGYYFYYGAGRHSGENVVKANTTAFNFDTETGGTGASELTAVGGSKGIDQTDNPILEAQQVKTLPSAPPTV